MGARDRSAGSSGHHAAAGRGSAARHRSRMRPHPHPRAARPHVHPDPSPLPLTRGTCGAQCGARVTARRARGAPRVCQGLRDRRTRAPPPLGLVGEQPAWGRHWVAHLSWLCLSLVRSTTESEQRAARAGSSDPRIHAGSSSSSSSTSSGMAAASSEPPRQHICMYHKRGAPAAGMILGSELPAELPAVRQISTPPALWASPCFVVLAAWFVGLQNVTTDEI